jgi:hypothetical protein
LFHHRSGTESVRHVDQGLDDVNPDHPVYDIARALADAVVSPAEARVALGLVLHDPKGLRQIELASGICDDSILKILPEAGAGTVLLSCTNRGQFAYDEAERQAMTLHVRRYRSSAEHPRATTGFTLSVQESRDSKDPKNLKIQRLENQSARRLSGVELKLLDPSLDLWNNPSEYHRGTERFGDAGWVLAMVTGMKPTTFDLDELSRILRVGDRQVRRIVDRLAASGYASKTKQGRRVQVTVDFSLMTHEDLLDDSLKTNRRAAKTRIQQHEGNAVKRLGTKIGRDVREMWQRRVVEARMFKDWAEYTGSRCWDPLIKVLSWKSRQEDRKDGVTRWEAEDALYRLLDPLTA